MILAYDMNNLLSFAIVKEAPKTCGYAWWVNFIYFWTDHIFVSIYLIK